MADTLRVPEGSNVTRITFLEFVDRHKDVEDEILDAKESVRSLNKRRKDLRKTITASGINLDEFDRACIDAQRSGEEREAADRQYREYMIFLQKPVGFQSGMDFPGDPALMAWSVHELHGVDNEGFEAGKAGHKRDQANTYSPGSEAAQRFDTAWLRGQAEIAATLAPNGSAPAAKGRGRPKGSKNKAGADNATLAPETTPNREDEPALLH